MGTRAMSPCARDSFFRSGEMRPRTRASVMHRTLPTFAVLPLTGLTEPGSALSRAKRPDEQEIRQQEV